MNTAFHRDTWAEIDLDAIYHNVSEMRSFIGDEVKLFAVVKANGYGHGDIEVAETALEAGADFLAVAFLDEALSLRDKGITAPILVLGAVRAEDVELATRHHISITVFDESWVREAALHIPEGEKLTVHLKCDTGMGRLGFREPGQLEDTAALMRTEGKFTIEGIYTHFATADELDVTYYDLQKERFEEFLHALPEQPPIVHCSNSAASMRFEESRFNAIRLGISMYGLSPSEEIKPLLPFELKEAFSLYTKAVFVKKLPEGEAVSYGATYHTDSDQWIATLPIGYADGWIRKLSGQEVLIDGKRHPIVGRICMDQCMVKLPGEYPVGTKVTLIGKDGDAEVTVDEIAKSLGTINYEVTCSISLRVPRVYKKGGKTVSIRSIH
ncbi:MAG: alanine racemase [Bacillus sp. (in: firmicutes)]